MGNRHQGVLCALVFMALAAATARGEERMIVQTDTSQLSVWVEGGGRETVLLLHGGPGVPDYLKEVASLLRPRFRTVRFDQRGVGESLAIGHHYEIDAFVGDIDAILQKLDVGQVHLLGHSWGGLLAQIYAARRPEKVKSLLLVSPSSGTGTVWQEMEKEVMAYNKSKATGLQWLGVGLDSLIGMMGSNGAYQRMFGRVWSYYFEVPAKAPPADAAWLKGIRAEAINGIRHSIVSLDSRAWEVGLSGLKVPVLVIYGAYDIYGPSKRRTFERWPGSQQVLLEHAGHLPWIQDRQEFLRVIGKFYEF